nr:DUF6691 family protein [Methylobacterium crusticola]
MPDLVRVLGFLSVAGAADPSLIAVLGGAALFTIGWAPSGPRPGPAAASISTGPAQVAVFVLATLVGMSAQALLSHARLRDVVKAYH